MSWSELWESYRQHLVSLGRAFGTVTSRQGQLQRFFRFCELQGLTLEQVTEETVRAFHRDLLHQPGPGGKLWTEATVATTLRTLEVFFAWARERRLMLVDPGPLPPLKKPSAPLPGLLTADQVVRLLEAPDPSTPQGLRDRAILELLYATGLRRRECHQLDLADLDRARRELTVRRGKGGKFRRVPLGDHLADVLERYLDQVRPQLRPLPGEPALFLSSQTGRRLSYGSLWLLVDRAAAAVGLQANVHSLRHAFASHLLEGGADVRHVQEMLGHSQVSTTQRYTQLQPLELIREHRHTHPRGRKR